MNGLPVVPSFAFLSAGALMSPQALAGAFNAAAGAPELDRAGIASDLNKFVSAAGGTFGMGDRLRNFAQIINPPPDKGLGPFALWQDVEEVLADVPQTVLDRARDALFPASARAARARTPAGAVVSYIEPKFAITIDGVPVEPPSDVVVFEVVKEKRRPVASAEEQKNAAIENMNLAIGSLGASFLAEHTSLLSRHVEAIISGEIGAPEDARRSVVEFIAESAAHAEAYGARVLQDAVLAEKLAPPLPVIPRLDEIQVKPKPWALKMLPEIPRAQPAIFGIDDLLSGRRALDLLSRSEDSAVKGAMDALGALKPDSFSGSAIARLQNAAMVVEFARRIKSPLDRARYLFEACRAGIISGDCLKIKGGKWRVNFVEPATRGQEAPFEWSDPIGHFIQSREFSTAEDEIARENPATRAIQLLGELLNNHAVQRHTFSQIRDLLKTGKSDEARKAIARIMANSLADRVGEMNEFGLHQMDSIVKTVEGYLAADSLDKAEALIDFAEEWIYAVKAAIAIFGEYREMLGLFAGKPAANKFMDIALEHFRIGNIGALEELRIFVVSDLQRMNTGLSAKMSVLSGRAHAALVAIIESARSLGVLPDSADRNRLVQRVPGVEEWLRPGSPQHETAARAYLARSGIPLPGEPGVLALGTQGIRGLTLLPEGKVAGLLPEAKPEATE